jgi:transposase InsO family protein
MYDGDDVELAMLALEEGMSAREAAELVGCSAAAVRRWAAGGVPHERAWPRGCHPGGHAYEARAAGSGSLWGGPRARPGARRTGAVAMERSDEGADRDAGLYEPPASGPLAGLTPDQVENRLLRAVLDDLKAGGSLPGLTSNRSKAELGERLRRETGLPLRLVARFLGISKSSYEYWRRRLADGSACAPDEADELGAEVERVFREEGRGARGYRFVHEALVRSLGRPVSEKVVREAMRRRGLRPRYLRRRRRYSSYAGETDEAPANLPLGPDGTHDFRPPAPNALWASDITEFALPCGAKVYLSPVVDLFDSRPVAWAAGTRPTAALADESLSRACATLRPGEAPVVHTDRGCHYRWPGWKAICAEHGLTRSMSRKGRCADNAAMEGFFGRLKNEFFYGRDWSGVSPAEFVGMLGEWMGWYCSGRLRAFREGDGVVWDTIDGRRARLGLGTA